MYLVLELSYLSPNADVRSFSFNAYYLEVASENIMRKLKRDSLGTLVKQEIGFFDQADSSAGGLTSAVSTHPANVGAATGIVTAQLLLLTANLLGSVLVGMILSWKMAVVCVPPILVLFFSVCSHSAFHTMCVDKLCHSGLAQCCHARAL